MIGTASAGKQDLVARLGAVAINYQAEDFVVRVKQETGEGVASAYDPIGPENYTRSYQALRPGGILVTYGSYAANQGGQSRPQVAAETRATRDRLARQHEAGKRVEGYFIAGMKAAHPDRFRNDLQTLLDLLAQGKLHPLVAERLPPRPPVDGSRRRQGKDRVDPSFTGLNLPRDIIRQATQLRAEYHIGSPDALQAGAGLIHGADAFITNDRRLERLQDKLDVIILDNFIEGD